MGVTTRPRRWRVIRPSCKDISFPKTCKRRSRMSDLMLLEPVELTDAELDMVTGGIAGGLVNVPIVLNQNDIDILNKANILNVTVGDVTLKDIANNNHIGVGAVIQALGGVAGVLQHV